MATTSTKTVDITLIDSSGNESVFKINNPTETITLTDVKNAYADILAAKKLFSKQGNPFTLVQKAQIVSTTITKEDLTEEE